MELLTGYAVFDWIATWANPACDAFFRIVTDLGYHAFYYLVIAPLFWVVDRRRACVLFLLVLASGYLNTVAKLALHTPRPDPNLARVLDFRPYQSGSNAFPSGHAQNAVVFWGYLAWWVGRRWFSIVAVSIIVLISFSRLYLSVHFPIDIVGGLVLGTGSLLALTPLLERWAEAEFYIGTQGAILLVMGLLGITLGSGDLTLALISGSLIGFLAGAVWLPQPRLAFRSVRQSSASVGAGLLMLLALAIPFQWAPHSPSWVTAQVAALWVLAFWCYPQALRRALLAFNRE